MLTREQLADIVTNQLPEADDSHVLIVPGGEHETRRPRTRHASALYHALVTFRGSGIPIIAAGQWAGYAQQTYTDEPESRGMVKALKVFGVKDEHCIEVPRGLDLITDLLEARKAAHERGYTRLGFVTDNFQMPRLQDNARYVFGRTYETVFLPSYLSPQQQRISERLILLANRADFWLHRIAIGDEVAMDRYVRDVHPFPPAGGMRTKAPGLYNLMAAGMSAWTKRRSR